MSVVRDDQLPTEVGESLTIRSEAAAEVGSVLLGAGMGSYRVKWAMARCARALGLSSFVSVVSYTDIVATATMSGRYRTRITRPTHPGVNVDLFYHTVRLVETLPEKITAAELTSRLAAITARAHRYGPAANAVAAGSACSAFTFLNGGNPTDMVCVLIAATLGQALRRILLSRFWNHFLVTLLTAIATCAMYLLIQAAPGLLGHPIHGNHVGYLATTLFLVPGFPLVTGLLDLVRSDFAAGQARVTYALLMIFAAATGLWLVGFFQGGISYPAVWTLPGLWQVLAQAAATAVGVFGFAVLFNSPPKIAATAASVSVVCNVGRFILRDHVGVEPQVAALIATTAVGLIAYLIASRFHIPRSSISVPAVVIMIPGLTMYLSYIESNTDNVLAALEHAVEGIEVVIAIALGLALGHLATSSPWRKVVNPQ
ncbi:threonine/serine exporter family protein [Corynebacterium uterequi]|uniref:Threonine/serine exporter-like N-terminal domain-containing protein n=1 Tax=Corynebacterium uterequi TaxID=1072256 RepID=A0A0G3HFX4_9CORY|nr:threonine/serine exporter family protein [Corynebacterium uterequi]AKK11625.1 hypothetical protein CUTER_08200 [Corynebacterium uterequi]